MLAGDPENEVEWAAWNKRHGYLSEDEVGGDLPFPAADMFRVIESSKDSNFDIDYLGESTKGDMNVRDEVFENYGKSYLTRLSWL